MYAWDHEKKPSLNFKFDSMLVNRYLCVTQIKIHLDCDPHTSVCPTVIITLHDWEITYIIVFN